MSVQPLPFIVVVMRKGSVLQKKQVSCILPFENNWPDLFLEHGSLHHSSPLSINGPTTCEEVNPHQTVNLSRFCIFSIVRFGLRCVQYPVMTVMLIYETSNMKHCFVIRHSIQCCLTVQSTHCTTG